MRQTFFIGINSIKIYRNGKACRTQNIIFVHKQCVRGGWCCRPNGMRQNADKFPFPFLSLSLWYDAIFCDDMKMRFFYMKNKSKNKNKRRKITFYDNEKGRKTFISLATKKEFEDSFELIFMGNVWNFSEWAEQEILFPSLSCSYLIPEKR